MRRLLLLVFATVIAAGALVAPEARADTAVTIQTSAYEPKDTVIKVGDALVWTNQDAAGHSVTADDNAFDSHPGCGGGGPCLENGEEFSHTFTTGGKYGYYCRLHGGPGGVGMAGTVTVLG